MKMRDFWENRIGARYYHFRYKDVLFLVLDSEDYSESKFQEMFVARDSALKIISGEMEGNYTETTYYNMPERTYGAFGEEQLNYFLEVLEKNQDVSWTFLLMHKPLWMREDSLGLSVLEKALQGRDYTEINGHLHQMSHRKRFGMDYLMLGTTGGSQTPGDSMAFDHISLVRMKDKPHISHLKMEGILSIDGRIAE